MPDLFTLELPRDAGQIAAEIRSTVAAMEGVEASGELATRAIDPVSIGVWVQMAAGVVDLGSKLGVVLGRVFGIVKDKQIKGAKLKLDGMEIELGELSVEEFERVVERLKKAVNQQGA